MTPTVTNNGLLAFNLNSNYGFAGVISGSGGVNKLGIGITTLTGANSYTGATNVNAGTLLVNGNQSGATGLTSVANGATLGGTGTIGGSVTVANGGTLSPGGAGNAPGALTINGGLTLSSTSNVNVNFGQANVPGGPLNDVINIGGNFVLDGTLNVTQTPGGTFGPGVYRIFNYSGSLTNNGLNVTGSRLFRADLGRQPGQPDQFGRPDTQLLGRRRRTTRQQRGQWRRRPGAPPAIPTGPTVPALSWGRSRMPASPSSRVRQAW
ncbi:autotransporter-associated beta strand repeat-containing protein [Sinorhizobium psoraleae]|uniref:Autotransporter-associated beta strand repeat-containing protein n=1 Tax=Sinorhizobium psoraleae TaxID=520838 RepID=A0ABT4KRW4_9HYPH|nr:autotransporter-associated beta strand repeat-containing protein [Sinorhizobium psoraleae]MCZ4094701.1 autotransporter-associated beta strand repeat-containing protein [Sinorhizobium psoraleae]